MSLAEGVSDEVRSMVRDKRPDVEIAAFMARHIGRVFRP